MLKAELSTASNWERRFSSDRPIDHPAEDSDEDDENELEVEGFLMQSIDLNSAVIAPHDTAQLMNR